MYCQSHDKVLILLLQGEMQTAAYVELGDFTPIQQVTFVGGKRVATTNFDQLKVEVHSNPHVSRLFMQSITPGCSFQMTFVHSFEKEIFL